MRIKLLYMGVFFLGLNSSAVFGNDDFMNGNNNNDDYSAMENGSAYNPGIYIGAQAGMSMMHYSPEYTVSGNAVESNKLAARGYVGYAFSQFISLELGYDYYGYPRFKYPATNDAQDILQHGMDLVAKATLPLDYGFGLYIKGGLAWVHRSTLTSNAGKFANKEANNKITPVGGLGINYWFAPNIALDLSWSKTMKVSDLPVIDFFSLGIIYRINT